MTLRRDNVPLMDHNVHRRQERCVDGDAQFRLGRRADQAVQRGVEQVEQVEKVSSS